MIYHGYTVDRCCCHIAAKGVNICRLEADSRMQLIHGGGLYTEQYGISSEDGNIRKNLVKFADNVPISYFKVRRKPRFDEKKGGIR